MGQKTVGEVAQLVGVSARTLRHYDAIGLVEPTDRSEAGYRLYDDDDLLRLHDVLFWRSLGFPLDEIRDLVADLEGDPMEALVLHRARLSKEVAEAEARMQALDEVIRRRHTARDLREADLVALFDGFDPADFEGESEERWGDTEAWAESKRRTKRYRAEDWARMKAEADEVNQRLAALLEDGAPPSGAEARVAAEAHRAHIDRWFYACTAEIHLELAEMYVADPRFAKTYDEVAPGLAQYVREAIVALHAVRPREL